MPFRPRDVLRPIAITPHYLEYPEGSSLITWGNTKVVCAASIEEKVPPWLTGKGKGWVTSEYDMLPRATQTRRPRDAIKGKPSGRTQEISRLIGRALRSVVDMSKLGERVITVDCDVIQADGGTRTAAITGGFVALSLAVRHLIQNDKFRDKNPQKNLKDILLGQVAAVSVGIVDGEPALDLDYAMDSRAQVDMNLVMNNAAQFIEVQGTGENATFSRKELDAMMDLALGVLPRLLALQERAVNIAYGDQTTLTL